MYYAWIKVYENGVLISSMRSAKGYIRKGNAARAAKANWSNHGSFTYEITISETNPFKEEN